MIIRRKRNIGRASGVSLSFMSEYGEPDVKRMLQDFYDGVYFSYNGLYSPATAREMALSMLTMSEEDWVGCFAAHPFFNIYQPKYAQMFATWAFSLALHAELIRPSATAERIFYLSSSAIHKETKTKAK